jgi:hypothetical protein
MPVSSYELDREVFQHLKTGVEGLKDWQGAASGIADYVASWGVERFWAMSRSPVLKDGVIPDAAAGSEEQRRYFAWGVARVVLCKIVGNDLRIQPKMTTADFQERFRNFDFNQQVLLTDLLIEIADTIQFWTMRLKDVKDSNNQV